MKIVVSKFDEDLATGWHWLIVDGNNTVAESSEFYTRKSDAKRGAHRFEQCLWFEYTSEANSCIPIEVLD